VKKGDIIVAGKNFGTGSSRPAALLFKTLGIEAIVAESVNGLSSGTASITGFLPLTAPEVTEFFKEGDVAEIDPQAGTIRKRGDGKISPNRDPA